jgi:hypothetical protein
MDNVQYINTGINLIIPTPPKAGSATLFVVLHGAISLVEGVGEHGPELRAHLIETHGVHDCLAGTWLSESPIPQGLVAKLECPHLVIPEQPERLNAVKNPLIRVDAFPDLHSKDIYAAFILPPPARISYFNRGSVTLDGDRGKLIGDPQTLTETHVLEYDLDKDAEFDRILLREHLVLGDTKKVADEDGIFWNCTGSTVFTKAGSGQVASLHIFNSPSGPASLEHNREEFHTGASILGAGGLTLDTSAGLPAGAANDPFPAGLSPLEIGGLDKQAETLQKLIDFIRTAHYDSGEGFLGGCKGCCATCNGSVVG